MDSSLTDSWTSSTDSWISSSTNSRVASAHEPSTLLQNRPHAAVKCEQPLASVLCLTVSHLIYSILDRFLWLHQNRSGIEHFHSRDWHLWKVPHKSGLVHQHGHRFVVSEHQYGRGDVWRDRRKPSIVFYGYDKTKPWSDLQMKYTKRLKLWGIRVIYRGREQMTEKKEIRDSLLF